MLSQANYSEQKKAQHMWACEQEKGYMPGWNSTTPEDVKTEGKAKQLSYRKASDLAATAMNYCENRKINYATVQDAVDRYTEATTVRIA